MAPRLSGQTSISGVVQFFASKSLLELRDREVKKIYNVDLKASDPC